MGVCVDQNGCFSTGVCFGGKQDLVGREDRATRQKLWAQRMSFLLYCTHTITRCCQSSHGIAHYIPHACSTYLWGRTAAAAATRALTCRCH